MTDMELVLNMLAEVTTKNLSQVRQPETFDESKEIAQAGGKTAGRARKDIEKQLGQSVISPLNAQDKPSLVVSKDETELLQDSAEAEQDNNRG